MVLCISAAARKKRETVISNWSVFCFCAKSVFFVQPILCKASFSTYFRKCMLQQHRISSSLTKRQMLENEQFQPTAHVEDVNFRSKQNEELMIFMVLLQY